MVVCKNCKYCYVITDSEGLRPTFIYCRVIDEAVDKYYDHNEGPCGFYEDISSNNTDDGDN